MLIVDVELESIDYTTSVGSSAVTRSFFGKSSGIFYMNSVRCSRGQSSLIECSHQALAATACGDGQYAGVRCIGKNNAVDMSRVYTPSSIRVEFNPDSKPPMHVGWTMQIWISNGMYLIQIESGLFLCGYTAIIIESCVNILLFLRILWWRSASP
jgi:hypothetical protein